jgi:hypothetical protein
MPPLGELQHAKGSEGVTIAKRWLESTTRFDVQWHVAVPKEALELSAPFLTVPQIGRDPEGFDMSGLHRDEDGGSVSDFYAEVKNYASQLDQRTEYKKFLTRAYSVLAKWHDDGVVRTTKFMWITWHPWGATDDYPKLWTADTVREACEHKFKKDAADEGELRVPADRVTDELCTELANRLSVIIVPHRLDDLLPKESQ